MPPQAAAAAAAGTTGAGFAREVAARQRYQPRGGQLYTNHQAPGQGSWPSGVPAEGAPLSGIGIGIGGVGVAGPGRQGGGRGGASWAGFGAGHGAPSAGGGEMFGGRGGGNPPGGGLGSMMLPGPGGVSNNSIALPQNPFQQQQQQQAVARGGGGGGNTGVVGGRQALANGLGQQQQAGWHVGRMGSGTMPSATHGARGAAPGGSGLVVDGSGMSSRYAQQRQQQQQRQLLLQHERPSWAADSTPAGVGVGVGVGVSGTNLYGDVGTASSSASSGSSSSSQRLGGGGMYGAAGEDLGLGSGRLGGGDVYQQPQGADGWGRSQAAQLAQRQQQAQVIGAYFPRAELYFSCVEEANSFFSVLVYSVLATCTLCKGGVVKRSCCTTTRARPPSCQAGIRPGYRVTNEHSQNQACLDGFKDHVHYVFPS